MQTYIATVIAKPGREENVTRFYQEMEPLLRKAPGFRERKIFRANAGAMADALHKVYTQEELSREAEPPHAQDTQFIMIEVWDSIEDRLRFSKSISGSRGRELIPNLLPQHSHEFYEDVSVR